MEIKIARTGKQCYASERPFEHQETVVSLVRYVDRALQREDYAREAWDPALATGAIAVWDATYVDPAIENAEPEESFSPLRRLFYDHAEGDERADLAVCYLAAQLLRRQKVFRLVKETEPDEDGVKNTLFADRIGDRLIQVRDPGLTLAELETGRAILVEFLQRAEDAGTDDEAAAEPEEEHNAIREEAAHADA